MSFICEQNIDWGDCDAAGVVFYPNYFRWMDAAFHHMTRAAGFGQRSLRADYGIFGTPLIDVGCSFKNPATYGDTLSVTVTLSHLGRSSLKVGYDFHCHGKLVACGFEARVFVRQDEAGELAPSAMPESVRAALQALRD